MNEIAPWVILAILAALVLLSLPILAIAALVKANRATREVEALRRQLDDTERRWRKASQAQGPERLPATPTTAAPPQMASPPKTDPPAAAAQAVPPSPRPAPANSELASAFKTAVAEIGLHTPNTTPKATAPTEPEARPTLRPASPPAAVPTRKISLEELIGAKLFVWIGAIALVFTAIYGLKYSIEQNWVSPWVRIASACLFGLALLGAAEWMRKKSERIGQALSGAGVLALYGTILAAVRMYHLIPSAAGFGAMVAVTCGAVILSLRHGAPTAVMALLGGMAMPMLLSDGGGHTGPLVSYLLVLQIGVIWVARKRNWSWLPALTLLGSLIWQGLLTFTSDDPEHRLIAAALSIGSAVTLVIIGARSGQEEKGKLHPVRLALVGVGAAVGFLGILSHKGEHDPLSLALLGLASAGLMVLTWKDARYRGMLPVAAGVGALVLGSWVMELKIEPWQLKPYYPLFWASFGLAGLWGMGGLILAYHAPKLRRIAVALSILVPVATLGILMMKGDIRVDRVPGDLTIYGFTWVDWSQDLIGNMRFPHFVWMNASIALSLFFTACAFIIARRESATPGSALARQATQAYALPAAGLAAFAVLLGIPHPWEGAGLAGLAVVLALFFTRYPLPILPALAAVISLAAPLALGLRGEWKLPNPSQPPEAMTLAYWGAPMLLVAVALWLFWHRQRKNENHSDPAQALIAHGTQVLAICATLLAAIGILLGIPHPWEATGWALLAVVLAYASVLLGLPILPLLCAGMAALVTGALALRGAWESPLAPWALGSAYSFPAILLAFSAWKVRQAEAQAVARLTAALTTISFSAGLVFFTLQVQQGLSPAWPTLATWVLLSLGQGVFALALWWTGHRILRSATVAQLAPFVAGFAGILWLAGAGLLANPLWSRETLGSWPIFNLLLPAYGLPAIGLLWSARFDISDKARHCFGLAGLVSAMLFVSMAVRHGFHPTDIRLNVAFTQAEQYTLSAAWAVLGAVLLALGILCHRTLLRYGALVVLIIAAAKGFLFDARHLQGLLRVGSFLGLGVTLMGLGFVWQKWVFGGKK